MNPLYSVKKNSDFRRLYTRGKSVVTPCMVVYCRKNKLGRNRSGYTVSSKIGHAVLRNRIRRRMREIYRLNASVLVAGYDIILVARGRASGAAYQKLEKCFLDACRDLKLIRENPGEMQ